MLTSKPSGFLDPNREQEIRQTLNEIKALEESGYFDDLLYFDTNITEDIHKRQQLASAQVTRSASFIRRVSKTVPLDNPTAPALAQFMSQLSVKDRSEIYKTETQKKFLVASEQVKILFGKIVKGEISSNAVVRNIVGSFMDVFMKDRNLILNLASECYQGTDPLYDHSLKLCLFSLSIASLAGYSRTQAVEIAQGALLSDVGMLLVPEQIRLKRGKLSTDELHEIRKHPHYSLTLLEPIHGLSETALIIPIQHHERISGVGYPENRTGIHVNKYSRIVAIADVFAALTNKRSYRESLPPYQAMVTLLSMGGQGLLCADHIRFFLKGISLFPLGSLVRLSDGRIAKVIAPNPTEFTKPLVSILSQENGIPLNKSDIFQVNLAESVTKIVEALPGKILSHQILDGF